MPRKNGKQTCLELGTPPTAGGAPPRIARYLLAFLVGAEILDRIKVLICLTEFYYGNKVSLRTVIH